jgi:inorganic pyrophosphatase
MYETKHSDGRIGRINHILWSDVFTCPECASDVVFWEAAVDKNAGKINDEFPCQSCGALLTKRNMDRSWISKYDRAISQNIRQARQVPVGISYSVNGKRFEKTPDKLDIATLVKSDEADIPYWVPITEIPVGDKTGEPLRIGLSHIHHFYTQSALHEMASLWAHFNKLEFRISRACLLSHTAASPYASKLRRFRADKKGGGPLAGTLYIASLITPPNPVLTVGRNVDFVARGLSSIHPKEGSAIVSAQSNSHYSYIEKDSLDYIFIDPPFGSNLNYSELNLLWEAWLNVITNNEQEAIENKTQGKGAIEYRQIMTACFREAYRVLKPGRWMTVEFSNTKASVWNSIQTALTEAGFIVANVSALDKKQGSYNAVSNTTSVKQDLVISAYKPNGGFEERFEYEAQTEEGVWDFIRTHLKYLPVTKKLGLDLVSIPERDPRILYDQVIAYYVRKGYSVPIDSQDFQLGLSQRFSERYGMYFLPEQVAEYDRKKMIGGGRPLQQSLFISDETSAIEWLRSLLRVKPQSFQDINPQFMKEISGWKKNEKGLELSTLLEQNFLCYDGKGPVPEQIHSYLSTNWKDMRNLDKDDPALVAKAKNRWYVPDPNKAGDLEKLREKALLKEFEEYKQAKKKLKVFRLEAVRAGFKKAWQERDYKMIITVAEKIPNKVLEEDPKLLMWYENAVTRMGGE